MYSFLHYFQASNLDTPGTLPGARLSDVTDNLNSNTGGASRVTVSEVTSPLDPTARTFPDPSETQTHAQPQAVPSTSESGFSGVVRPASTPAPAPAAVSSTSETVPTTSGLADLRSTPISDFLTPMTVSMVPELGDIATMPISDILAPSTAATLTVTSEPIVTSPPSVDSTVTTGLGDDGLSVPTPEGELSLELVPKDSSDLGQLDALQQPHILKRALSTEEIEQK